MFKCNNFFCGVILPSTILKKCKSSVQKSEVKMRRIINLHKENKSLFGKLVETKRDKAKNAVERLKNEISAVNNKDDRDSEAFWFKRLSSAVPVKSLSEPAVEEIHIPKEEFVKSTKQRDLSIKPPVSKTIISREDINKSNQSINYGPRKLLLKEIRENLQAGAKENIKKNDIPFSETLLHAMVKHPLFKQDNFKYPLLDNVQNFRLPSVSRVLSGTMSDSSREALILWKKRQIELHGEEKFKEIQQEHLRVGKEFHESIQHFFQTGSPASVQGDVEGCWNSVKNFVKQVDQPELIEASLTHPTLGYIGVLDCVANYKGNLTLIEWKKSDRVKKTLSATYDAPIQLSAYVGALAYDARYQKEKGAKFLQDTNCVQGVVVVAYTDGSACDIHELDLKYINKYWTLWLQRLQEYWIRYRDGTLQEPI